MQGLDEAKPSKLCNQSSHGTTRLQLTYCQGSSIYFSLEDFEGNIHRCQGELIATELFSAI